jgi:hypothetical protein
MLGHNLLWGSSPVPSALVDLLQGKGCLFAVTAKAGRRQDYCTTPSPPQNVFFKNYYFKILKF